MSAPTLPPTCGLNGGLNANAEPCGSTLGLCSDCGRCIQHCEHREEERRALVSAGGRAAGEQRRAEREEREAQLPRGLPAPPQTVEDARAYASWATDAVARREIDARTAREIKELLKVLISACEKADLAARLSALEQREKARERAR